MFGMKSEDGQGEVVFLGEFMEITFAYAPWFA